MDPTQPGPSNPSPEVVRDMTGAIKQLQWLVVLTAIGMLLVCVPLAWFLSKQVNLTESRIAQEQPRFTAIVSNYRSTSEPLVSNFLAALQNYAASNRNFQPVLDRYRPALSAYLPAAPHQGGAGTNTSAQPKPAR